jgi:hypothetical protein
MASKARRVVVYMLTAYRVAMPRSRIDAGVALDTTIVCWLLAPITVETERLTHHTCVTPCTLLLGGEASDCNHRGRFKPL